MQALLALVRAEIQLHFSNRRAVLMSIVAPILIAAFFGSLFGGSTKMAGIPIGVVDLDASPLSQRVVALNQGRVIAEGSVDSHFTNIRAIVGSFGLMVPWAQMRVARPR